MLLKDNCSDDELIQCLEDFDPSTLSPSKQIEFGNLAGIYGDLVDTKRCEDSLAHFTQQAWKIIEPGTTLVWNWHLDVICAYLEAYFSRRIKRLILNVPPGSMKSILFSVMGPTWAWAKWPTRRVINITNELGLATRDCKRMRDIVEGDWYQSKWGDKVEISRDQREKTNFANTATGFRQGLGVGSGVTGKRGTDILIDDALDAKKAFSDPECQTVNDTYDQAISSRLNNLSEDGIGVIMQRLRTNDLTGHLLAKKKTKWVVVRIPMEYEGVKGYDPVKDLGPEYKYLIDPRTKDKELMFPARFPRVAVEALKEDLGEYGTAGQLQQRPSPLGGGIIKKSLWQMWPKDKPIPRCYHIFASYDTAYNDKDYKDSAYSARTTWGVFDDEITGRPAMIMFDHWYSRADYSSLKREARKHYKESGCDRILIEKKASGISLIQDMRRMTGISVRGYDPGKLDKVGRAHMALPMMESGLVYYPDREWARKVIEFISQFPTGGPPSSDLTDTATQAINYVRNRSWAKPPEDDDLPTEQEEYSEEYDEDHPNKRESAY